MSFVFVRDRSRLGHKPDYRLGWSSEYVRKSMYACRSVSVACRPAEKRRRRGEIRSIHRSILVGHRRPNQRQGVNNYWKGFQLPVSLSIAERANLLEIPIDRQCWLSTYSVVDKQPYDTGLHARMYDVLTSYTCVCLFITHGLKKCHRFEVRNGCSNQGM